jgi:spore germination protein Q
MMNNPYQPGMQVPYGYPMPPYQGGYQGTSGGNPPMIPPPMPGGTTGGTSPGPQGGINVPGQLPVEESYIENILRLNLGKLATLYLTYENNSEWNAKIFKGRLEAAGRDHIIISDPKTGMRYLLLMVNLDYITFDEELQYLPSFGPGQGGGFPGGGPSGR